MEYDIDDGYVPLFRKSLSSQVFQDVHLWKVWCWCLLRAGYKERNIPIRTGAGCTQVTIKEGQFVYGRKSAARELHMKKSSVRNRMQKLQNMGNLDIKTNTHYSIVTICKWNSYRDLMFGNRTGTRTTTGQPQDTNNKVNNVNKYNALFEKIWLKYPKRVGKKKALAYFESSIRGPADFERIRRALDNYLKSKEVAGGYIQNGSNWFAQWQDWVDYECPQEQQERRQL